MNIARPPRLLLALLAAVSTISIPALYSIGTASAQTGIPAELSNLIEQARITGDRDDDGVADELDADNDNDTIPDVYEGDVDSDRDGIPDRYDLDSDNDGVPDIVEALLDYNLILELDANLDGRIDAGVNTGRNGLANAVELIIDSTNLRTSLPDSDADRVPDFRDLDSDNDGLSDRAESSTGNDFVFAQFQPLVDANRDGLQDERVGRFSFLDPDDDGLYNHIDTDSDQDGVSDLRETAGESRDRDNNGRIDQFLDFDGNGYQDQLQGSPLQFVDSDNDGNADHLDLDSDNDGVFDVVEAGRADINGDGMTDDNVLLPASDPPELDPEPVDPETIDSSVQPADTTNVLVTGLDGNAHGGCVAITGKTNSFDPLLWLLPGLAYFLRRKSSSPAFIES